MHLAFPSPKVSLNGVHCYSLHTPWDPNVELNQCTLFHGRITVPMRRLLFLLRKKKTGLREEVTYPKPYGLRVSQDSKV